MTLLYCPPCFLDHETGGHPERADRIRGLPERLAAEGLARRCRTPEFQPVSRQRLARVHSPAYIDEVWAYAKSGGGYIESDTVVSPASYDVALMAAGSVCDAVERLLRGEDTQALCLVRPPGHHAMVNRAMGFCIFNNIAVAARYAIKRKSVERVLIVDWDAHHGNGTQETFYEDSEVLYISLHQYPHYPGTGWIDETGKGKGEGYTVNLPFPAGTGEADYLEAFRRVIIPAAEKFQPGLVMVSAGYDSHVGDLLCSMRLTDSSYRKMTDELVAFARGCCNGRLILTLEGGYNLNAEARSIVQTVAGLAGVDIPG